MTYEYEDKLLDYVSHSKTYEEYKAMSQELQEVYRKAKAWEELKGLLMEEYPQLIRMWESTHGEGEHAEYYKTNEMLEHMDKLDGTNEFSNLLSDLEDE